MPPPEAGDFTPALSFVDFSSVTDTQDHDLIPFQIEHDTIVTDAKPVRTQLRLPQWLGMFERIRFVATEGLADALLYLCVKRVDISDRTVSVDQPILHRPNTSP